MWGLVERILNHDPETVRMTVGERSFPKRDPRAGGVIYTFGFGFSKSPHMVATQFGHAAVFELLMQRSPAWLRLINAAELGDEALVERIVTGHPQLFTKLSVFAARRIIGRRCGTIRGRWRCCWGRGGRLGLRWRTIRRRCTMRRGI